MLNDHINHCSVLYNEKVYVISGSHNNRVEAFDIKSNEWEKIPKLPRRRELASATVIMDRIFVFGGKNDKDNYSKKIFYYDNKDWAVFEYKVPVKACGIGVLNISEGQVLLFGGNSQEKNDKNDNTSA